MIGVGEYRTNDEVRKRVESVLDSNRISYGPQTAELEELWAAIHDSKHSIAVSSGTAALHVALYALKEKHKWKSGSAVYVPALTFVATVNVILHCNLRPVFVDVERETGLMSPAALRKAMVSDGVAIMPVHLFGQPANMTEICKVADDYGLEIVEDACEAFAAVHRERSVGSFGAFGAFSTYVAHHIPAGGGGLITTQDDDLARLARSLVNHGRDVRYWNMDMKEARPEVLFRFPYVGFNYRTTEWQSAVTMGLMQGWKERIDSRQHIATFYNESFSGDNRFSLTVKREGNYHSWMMFPMIYKAAEKEPGLKFDLMNHLKANGIDSREALPLLNNPAYRNLNTNADLNIHKNARAWTYGGIYVPCHDYMTLDDASRVVEAIDSYKA